MRLDIGKAFSYPTEDEGWVAKVGIGAAMYLFSFLLIPGIIASGYVIRALRNRATDEKLPDWDDWGDFIMKGLILLVISIAYALVPAGLFAVGFGSLILGMVGAGRSDSALPALGGGGIGLVLGGLGVLLLLVIAVLMPMVMLRFAITGELGAAFQIGEILSGITANVGEYVILLAVTFGANMVASLVSGVIPILGFLIALPACFYIQLVMADLLGQYYRNNMAEQAPAA